MCFRHLFLAVAAAVVVLATAPAFAEQPVEIKFSRAELEAKWQVRIQSFLDKGVIPLIGLQSSLKRKDGERYLEDALPAMDELGVALIAFDGFQAKKKNKAQKGYRWGYYIHQAVNAYPDRFILATNGNHGNNSWLKGKGGFVRRIEDHVRSGQYPIMGEFDFRNYIFQNQQSRCKRGGGLDIPLDGDNGHRLFRLSAETGVAFVIHLEPEDASLDSLEKMLKAYPKAKVIWSHFGQIRYPERETRFTPDLVRRLLATYPNLYYDISTGHPNRKYKCGSDRVLDTVIWDEDSSGQTDTLKPAYREILTKFSTRFVSGLDYGGGRRPPALAEFIAIRANNVRLIIRDLPDAAKHDIGYRNAWKLLTGKDWR